MRAVLQPIPGQDGAIASVAGFLREPAAGGQPAPAGSEGEHRFRDLVEHSSDWIWEVDRDLRYTYASPKCFDLLGYTPEEMIGRQPWDFMPRSEAERLCEGMEQFQKNPQPFRGLENRNLHRDGSLRVLETSAVPVYDAAGRFCGLRGS